MTITKRTDAGFTMIELLTVVLVVGVLAAISIPALAAQRDKAHAAAMRSDLKSLINAQAAYVADGSAFTNTPALLVAEGYRPTQGVTGHLAAGVVSFLACTKHESAPRWLVYDSATSAFTMSSTDCAGATPP